MEEELPVTAAASDGFARARELHGRAHALALVLDLLGSGAGRPVAIEVKHTRGLLHLLH